MLYREGRVRVEPQSMPLGSLLFLTGYILLPGPALISR